MGQQQLLLLVLGIVIVGLAVVAGINAFQENRAKSNTDALINEGMRIATDAEAWRLKPDQFGGGGGDYGGSSTNLESMIGGKSTSGNIYESPWGDIEWKPSTEKFTLTNNDDEGVGEITTTSGNVKYVEPSS